MRMQIEHKTLNLVKLFKMSLRNLKEPLIVKPKHISQETLYQIKINLDVLFLK